jgi:cob(I)alamin adenosyltransferase
MYVLPAKSPSISTRRGDDGSTALAGGVRISKGDSRVEASGAVDELNAAIGVARAHCGDEELATRLRAIQVELFPLGSAISRKAGGRRNVPEIDDAMVARLSAFVAELESRPGLVRDWTVPGAMRESSFFETARTVCRRAERATVRLVTIGEPIQRNVLAYLNRLSDVLWLCARALEAAAGIDARLRDDRFPGPPWSQAW